MTLTAFLKVFRFRGKSLRRGLRSNNELQQITGIPQNLQKRPTKGHAIRIKNQPLDEVFVHPFIKSDRRPQKPADPKIDLFANLRHLIEHQNQRWEDPWTEAFPTILQKTLF